MAEKGKIIGASDIRGMAMATFDDVYRGQSVSVAERQRAERMYLEGFAAAMHVAQEQADAASRRVHDLTGRFQRSITDLITRNTPDKSDKTA